MIALTILAALVAMGCAAACTRRLYFATHALAFHPAVWLERVRSGQGDVVTRAIEGDARADWERELVSAVAEPDAEVRTARVNEQLSELDFRLTRWARVPRVCASIASSAGLLFGSLILRFGLTSVSIEEGGSIDAVVLQAVNVAALGVAGASFAIAAQVRARKASKQFQRDADTLVEALERRWANPSTIQAER